MKIPTKPLRQRTTHVRLASERTLATGDTIVFLWGGTDGKTGTERTTTGRVIELWTSGEFKVARNNRKRNANGDITRLVSINGVACKFRDRRRWGDI